MQQDPYPSLRPARELRAIRSFDAIPFSPLEKADALKPRPSSTNPAPEHTRPTGDDSSSYQDVSLSRDARQSTSSASSDSSYSKPFGLSSPFPRPVPIILSAAPSYPAQSSKENQRAPNLSSSSAHHLIPTQHIRVSAKPSSSFFPFRSSILTTSSSYADLRAVARSPASFDEYLPRSSEDGSGESSDVDLDLSFDFHPSAGYDRAEYRLTPSPIARSPQSAEEGWIGIDMAREEEGHGSSVGWSAGEEDVIVQSGGRRHGVPEGELVRSPSGKLTGVQKRVRSAVELRRAYLDAEEELRRQEKGKGKEVEPEAFAIMMEGGSPVRREGGTARREWVRKTSLDPSLNLGMASRARTEGPAYPRSITKGFAFNPTDPLAIPLPDSPLTPPSSAAWEGRSSRSFPLPLKRFDRERRGLGTGSSPLSSPAWSIGSFFLGTKPRESLDAVALDVVKGTTPVELREDSREEDAEKRSKSPLIWADELAGKTLEYLGMRKKASTPGPAPPTSSVASSPLFGGTTPSDFGISDGEDSEATTPDSPEFRTIAPLENPVEVGLGVPRAKGGRTDLDGLGLDFTGGEDDRVPPIPPRGTIHARRLHRPIPSLSVSPPPASDDGASSAEDSTPDDPTPSSRLTYRPTPRAHQIPSIDTTVAREHYSRPPSRIFGPPKTMSGAFKGAERFSFVPAPLSLVNEQLTRNRASTLIVAKPLPLPAPRQQPFSLISFGGAISIPGTLVDEMIPAKLCFIAGFLFGPWCWLLGGWWIRAMDGELWKSRGVRCRTEGCDCGGMVKWHSVAETQRRGMAQRCGGVDQWVFVCRAASVASGSLVLGLAVAAVVAAA